MNRLLRIPFTDRALVIADDPHGQAEHYPGGLSFNTTATAEHVRGGEVIDRYELGSGVITTAGINKWAAMLNAKQGPLYTSGTTALGPYMIGTGTGTNAPAVTDTGLQTAIGTTGTVYGNRYNLPSIQGLNAVTYANGVYVAVGNSGTIVTSYDGLTWTVRTSNAGTNQLTCVIYFNSLFIAAGAGGIIVTSPDGVTWTGRTSNTAGIIQNFATNGSTVVASALNGSINTAILISSSDGLTWTARVQAGQTSSIGYYWVTYGNGIFLAGGYNIIQSALVALSPDGITWNTGSNMGTGTASWAIVNSVCGVIVGTGGSIRSSTTTTTANQFQTRTSNTAQNLYCVTYANSLFVAVGANGTVVTSPDGVTWTARTSNTNSSLNSVIYANSSFVALGANGVVATSSDGITWNIYSAAVSSQINYQGFSYNSSTGMYVACGNASELISSSNGIAWTRPAATYTFSVAYTTSYSVSEFGIFGATAGNALSGATLFDRRTFTPINVVNGDSITFQWALTGAAGG